jgi:hypothetical protein
MTSISFVLTNDLLRGASSLDDHVLARWNNVSGWKVLDRMGWQPPVAIMSGTALLLAPVGSQESADE